MSENVNIAQLAQGIADALGWTVGVESEPTPYITLRGEGDDELYLRLDSGRVRISGEYPRLYGRFRMVSYCLPYGERAPSITCAVDRGGEAIARDIERRLLSDYRVLLEKVKGMIASQMIRNEATKRAADRLIALFPEGTYIRADEGESWRYVIMPNGSIHKIEIRRTDTPEGSVNIEIRGASGEIAKAVCVTVGKLEGWYDEDAE